MVESELVHIARELVASKPVQFGGIGIGSGGLLWALNSLLDIFIKLKELKKDVRKHKK